MDKHVSEWSRKELLALPERKWDACDEVYDSLLVFSARTKHDSGWSQIVVIGCRDHKPVEICGRGADDLEWKFPPPRRYGSSNEYSIGQVRSDCTWPAGILHFWERSMTFKVGCALSSVTIEVQPRTPSPGAAGGGR